MFGRKSAMFIAFSRCGISISYRCYKLPDYGKQCTDRDDGNHCMKCKYCKAELSAYDATRLLEAFGRRVKNGEGGNATQDKGNVVS